jgi:hypothetical protein
MNGTCPVYLLYLKLNVCIGDKLNDFELFGLALKLGFHPLTKALLVAISTSPPQKATYGSIAIEDSGNLQ